MPWVVAYSAHMLSFLSIVGIRFFVYKKIPNTGIDIINLTGEGFFCLPPLSCPCPPGPPLSFNHAQTRLLPGVATTTHRRVTSWQPGWLGGEGSFTWKENVTGDPFPSRWWVGRAVSSTSAGRISRRVAPGACDPSSGCGNAIRCSSAAE